MKKMLILFSFLLVLCCYVLNFVLFPIKYKKDILYFSSKYNLKPELTCSVICAESGFRDNAISSKGAIGLMQLMPSTAKWIYENIFEDKYSDEKIENKETNIELGCYYLSYLFNKFDNIVYVLCAYNAGETTVRNWIVNYSNNNTILTENNIPYKETKQYVKNILNNLKVYSLKLKQ